MLRQKQRRRPPPRAFWLLVAGLIGCAALLWWQYRDRPEPAPPIVSDRQRLVSAAITALRADPNVADIVRSEELTSELQSLMRISYAVFCLKKIKTHHLILRADYFTHITHMIIICSFCAVNITLLYY